MRFVTSSDDVIAPPQVRRPTGNRFIDALPGDVADAVASAADLRVWDEGAALGRRGEPLARVDFPISGVISHLEAAAGGPALEAAAVGNDGVSGVEALLGVATAQYDRVTVVPVAAFSADPRALARMVDASDALRRLTGRYAVAALRAAALRTACDRHHLLEHRLAGWIDALHRASGARELRVTHALAARLLGAERAGITRAYARIAATGAIRYERGRVRVRDRGRLAAAACACTTAARAVMDAVYR